MHVLGSLAGRLEDAFGVVWSLGEIALALTRPDEVLRDPHSHALVDDVARHGFHAPIDFDALDLVMSPSGRIEGTNPYRRVCGSPHDRILGTFHRASRRRASSHLVVVCHCYGVPSAPIMRRLFGLDRLGVDMALNVMGHHQPGTYRVWPGSGLVSARLSRLVENMRSAVTGVRALVRWLRAREGYERVTVLGFSIGGQLALHLAHAGDVDGAVLYCPIASLRCAMREIGLMRLVAPWIEPAFHRLHGTVFEELLELVEPLAMPLAIDEERMHVIAQRHDALASIHQIHLIRRKYPRVRWTELPGTHLLPLGITEVHRAVREAVGCDGETAALADRGNDPVYGHAPQLVRSWSAT